jgi:hypothetical protein
MAKPLSILGGDREPGVKDLRDAVASPVTKFDLEDQDSTDDSDSDPENGPDLEPEDDEESADFGGFSPKTKDTDDPILSEVRALREELAQLRSAQTKPSNELSQEQFEELSKKDPRAALTLLVADVMQNMKPGSGSTAEVAAQITKDMSRKQMVNEFRKLIQSKYSPKENTKLAAVALKLYEQRGFDVSADPAAEYVAFTLAAERYPDLVPQQTQRGKSSRASDTQPSRGSGRGGSLSLDGDLKRLADRWGVNTKDPKAIKRLVTLRSHYDSRRIDNGRGK